MRIAFTHNLQVLDSEEQAEFDTPQTVDALVDSLRRLGHDVEPVEVSVPPAELIARLESARPDLVFNTAEGRIGRSREAFYPALFEQLGLPFTGSDAYACLLTLDKTLTKRVVEAAGVPAPRGILIRRNESPALDALRYPLFVKPNAEGSSMGITADSVVETPEDLALRVRQLLARFPGGVLVEEYVEGRDVVVPWLEAAAPLTRGVLPAVEYVIDLARVPGQRHAIYEYTLKHEFSDAVDVRAPADLTPEVAQALARHTATAIRALDIRDLGRLDFRVAPDGHLWFIEANALPSLEPGAGIYAAAAAEGMADMEDVLEAVLRSACQRQGLAFATRVPRKRKRPLRVGLAFNLKRVKPGGDGSRDEEAEYDAPTTIDAVEDAIHSYGYDVVRLEATPDLLTRITSEPVDLVFNIAEGFRGRSREAFVPALLDLLDIPYTGSDAATLALTLDKALAKQVVRQAGVPTPDFFVMQTGRERLPPGLSWPLVAKPLAEGSSKGIAGSPVVHSEADLRARAASLIERYRQPVIVEAFLPGREFTVGLLGERRVRALPPMEIVFLKKDEAFPTYTFAHKQEAGDQVRYDAPAAVDARLGRELERVARDAFRALGCRDVARVDLRCDAKGHVHFIECNPLPGLTPGWSDLCLVAAAAGIDYRALIGAILDPGLRRMRAQRAVSRGTRSVRAQGSER